MALTTIFKSPESSVVTGLAEAAAVYAIYNASLPPMADIRSADPHNTDVESLRRAAAWKSAAVLGLVFLLTHDLNSALIGGAALAGIDLMVKHSNGVNPTTGQLAGRPAAGMPADNDVSMGLPDYTDTSANPADDTGY